MSAACSGWLRAANSCSDTAAIMPDRRGDRRSPLVSSVCHVLEPHGQVSSRASRASLGSGWSRGPLRVGAVQFGGGEEHALDWVEVRAHGKISPARSGVSCLRWARA